MKEIELLKTIFKNSPDILEPLNEIDKEIERLQDMDKILRNENINLKLRINKAIDKLYCWGEVLNPNFQQEMLNILKGSDKE